MTKEVKQQFTLRITQANSTELVVILYEMALSFLQDAKDAGQKQEWAEFKESIRKTRGCINELMQSLHMEYEPAKSLFKLYMFVSAGWRIRRCAGRYRCWMKWNQCYASFMMHMQRLRRTIHLPLL